jgi:hypothetical protein
MQGKSHRAEIMQSDKECEAIVKETMRTQTSNFADQSPHNENESQAYTSQVYGLHNPQQISNPSESPVVFHKIQLDVTRNQLDDHDRNLLNDYRETEEKLINEMQQVSKDKQGRDELEFCEQQTQSLGVRLSQITQSVKQESKDYAT